MNDLWEIEREAKKRFRETADEIGFARADLALAELEDDKREEKDEVRNPLSSQL